MEEFKKKIRNRIYIGAGLLFLGAAIIGIGFPLGEHVSAERGIPQLFFGHIHLHGFNAGMILGFMVCIVGYMLKCASALRNDEKLRRMYVKETDERLLLIYQKSGSVGMNIAIGGLLVGGFIAAYFDITIFITLMSAGCFTSLVRDFLKIYYKYKL